MFDPERDEVAGNRRAYVRLLVILAVGALTAVALWPSISGFAAGPEAENICVAIRDGWGSEPHDPGPRAPIDAQVAYLDWRQHTGACVDASRRRLLLTAVVLAGVCGTVTAAAALTKRGARRRTPAPVHP